MSEVLYPEGAVRVLDKGFVRLVDVMGSDESIVSAARVSYGKGTKTVNEDRGLIRYLMRHEHTTPFEMVEFKFHCRMPIFVARQWIRHRTASVNEVSGRYSEMPDLFYVPAKDKVTKQSTVNKQGGSQELIEDSNFWAIRFETEQRQIHENYTKAIASGMRKELARINLPLSQYTEWYWKIDLKNLLHFLKLRLDSHAQYEIQVFGQAMAEMVKSVCPLTWEAFEDYVLNSVNLTALDVKALKILNNDALDKNEIEAELQEIFSNKRERQEFDSKLIKLST